jgi:phytanoyl-CoA hydroxylase
MQRSIIFITDHRKADATGRRDYPISRAFGHYAQVNRLYNRLIKEENYMTAVQTECWTDNIPWIDYPEADIEAYVSSLKSLPDYDLFDKLSHWRENGFVIFENAVSTDLIDEYLHDIDHLVASYDRYEVPIEIRGSQMSSRDIDEFPADMTGVKLNQMQCFSRAASRLSLTPRVQDFLSHVFQGPASVCQSLTFWRGSEQAIHIDYPYVCQQTKLPYLAASWIPLEDVHPDAGPLAYYPGGHKVEKSGFFDWGGGSIIYNDDLSRRSPSEFASYLYQRMDKAGIARREFFPKRGDVLIWHGNLPHEGTAVRDPRRTRKSYVTHYTAEATLPDWMRNFDQCGRPVGVFENGGFSYRYKWFDESACLPSWKRETV